ncbi:hypothetical protein PS876_00457 [Pseudomonas fluorescens]|uniref:hypothetical protein n=1 Tax=Pseudomonas fluorescens TaxID=294 RepID=UPI00125649C1|nr:hypothetical protein [Pseudomonas fluorescens]VVO54419.1 hypothetical protein PS876_00457 [Pseudomonas fluorescens]
MNNTTSHQGRLKSFRAAGIGNALGWFDWTLYATFSVYLAGNLFDKACQCIRADQAFDLAKASCSEERNGRKLSVEDSHILRCVEVEPVMSEGKGCGNGRIDAETVYKERSQIPESQQRQSPE